MISPNREWAWWRLFYISAAKLFPTEWRSSSDHSARSKIENMPDTFLSDSRGKIGGQKENIACIWRATLSTNAACHTSIGYDVSLTLVSRWITNLIESLHDCLSLNRLNGPSAVTWMLYLCFSDEYIRDKFNRLRTHGLTCHVSVFQFKPNRRVSRDRSYRRSKMHHYIIIGALLATELPSWSYTLPAKLTLPANLLMHNIHVVRRHIKTM